MTYISSGATKVLNEANDASALIPTQTTDTQLPDPFDTLGPGGYLSVITTVVTQYGEPSLARPPSALRNTNGPSADTATATALFTYSLVDDFATPTDPPSSPTGSGPSPGTIAAAVLGAVLGTLLIAGVLTWLARRYRWRIPSPSTSAPGAKVEELTSTSMSKPHPFFSPLFKNPIRCDGSNVSLTNSVPPCSSPRRSSALRTQRRRVLRAAGGPSAIAAGRAPGLATLRTYIHKYIDREGKRASVYVLSRLLVCMYVCT